MGDSLHMRITCETRTKRVVNAPAAALWLAVLVGGTILLALLATIAGCKQSNEPTSKSLAADVAAPVVTASRPASASALRTANEIEFVSIPGGSGRVGSVSSEPGRDARLERLRDIRVKPFEMSRTEITQAQFYAVMEPDRFVVASAANLPVTGITWYQATQFCELLTLKSGIEHRLPTEVEWEYACRAGSSEMMSVWLGNSSLTEAIASFHRGDSGKLLRGIKASCNVDSGKLLPVGHYRANAFGLHDMHGNVWEWISFDEPLTEPPSPLHAPLRGGSAISTNAFECRSANRAWQFMNKATDAIGFRVVRVR